MPEAESDQANELLRRWARGELALVAPDILQFEIATALWKRAQRGLLPPIEALEIYSDFVQLEFPVVSSSGLAAEALRLALENQLTVYDGLYVGLALETGWDFVTADKELHGLLASRFPQVRLLAEWV